MAKKATSTKETLVRNIRIFQYLSVAEVAKKARCSQVYARQIRDRYLDGSPLVLKHPVHEMNWDLPTADLSRIWKVPYMSVAHARPKMQKKHLPSDYDLTLETRVAESYRRERARWLKAKL